MWNCALNNWSRKRLWQSLIAKKMTQQWCSHRVFDTRFLEFKNLRLSMLSFAPQDDLATDPAVCALSNSLLLILPLAVTVKRSKDNTIYAYFR